MTVIAEFSTTGGRLAGRVYTTVKQRIVDGVYQPGQRMPIDELTEEFGVSKQPIREAFRTLASDGLLDIQPQIGTIVPHYSRSEFVAFYRVLAGYEGAAAEAAAVHCRPQDAAELRALLGRDLEGLALRRSNREFHMLVHGLANSRLISLQSQRMWDLSDFLLSSVPDSIALASRATTQHDDHWQIVDALEAHDAERAGAIMTAHIKTIGDMLDQSDQPEGAII